MKRFLLMGGVAAAMIGGVMYFKGRTPEAGSKTTALKVAGETPIVQDGPSACQIPPEWLPMTPAPAETQPPLPHPASDCEFYRPAWQRFLQVTQPAADNTPAFLTYASFNQLFLNHSTPGLELTDTAQAALPAKPGGSLIDQHGRFIYYAIHINPAMTDYLKANNFNKPDGLANISTAPAFPTDKNFIELKSAWTIVDDPKAAPNYFVAQATVPHYTVVNGKVTADSQPQRSVFVALLALHVVFTVPGHPELVWSSFEHVGTDAQGNLSRDNAPAPTANPSSTSGDTKFDGKFPLYLAGTPVSQANKAPADAAMAAAWDETAQAFTKGGTTLQTSVYRPYPFSKTDAGDQVEDTDVVAINGNMTKLFGTDGEQNDVRKNYRLVGAVWFNDPTNLKIGKAYKNPLNQSTDDPASIIAGEGRLGSTAIESFTEREDNTAGGAPNCFSCHDTQAIRRFGGTRILPASLLNVSHLMSKFKDSPLSK